MKSRATSPTPTLPDLWRKKKLTVIFVTHSIHEAGSSSRVVYGGCPSTGSKSRTIDAPLPRIGRLLWCRPAAVGQPCAPADTEGPWHEHPISIRSGRWRRTESPATRSSALAPAPSLPILAMRPKRLPLMAQPQRATAWSTPCWSAWC